MYYWRKLTDKQRQETLDHRRIQHFPKHSPPHFDFEGENRYIITAACYEHHPIIGSSTERLSETEVGVLEVCEKLSSSIYAWCILPNHYHILLRTAVIKLLRKELGLFHGRTSFKWNGEDGSRGRQVWHNCFEKRMRSERHYFASLNCVLNNAVHHGYVERWQDWPWSNARDYLEAVGRERAAEIWNEYPILDFGKNGMFTRRDRAA